MDSITIIGLTGILTCSYALVIKNRLKKNQNYKAMCDINDMASCSHVLTSEYSNMAQKLFDLNENSIFNMSNVHYGLLFYMAIAIYPIYPFTIIPFREILLFTASSLSILSCFCLAYILYFKLKTLCLICVFTYVINVILFWLSYKELIKYYGT